jgi:hypothetical protein
MQQQMPTFPRMQAPRVPVMPRMQAPRVPNLSMPSVPGAFGSPSMSSSFGGPKIPLTIPGLVLSTLSTVWGLFIINMIILLILLLIPIEKSWTMMFVVYIIIYTNLALLAINKWYH